MALAVMAAGISLLSFFPLAVEQYYTYGVYALVSKLQRNLSGWFPFSIGDVLYMALIAWLLYAVGQLLKRIIQKRADKKYLFVLLKKTGARVLCLYIIFYGLWGLNYSRIGIAGQLGLQGAASYRVQDLDTLVQLLHQRLNAAAEVLTPAARDSFVHNNAGLNSAVTAYEQVAKQFPFLQYNPPAIKASLWGCWGNYMGFQGYYNPFSGEAQVNTTIPACVAPFVATHEIAHQLGYAKESEANFVGFLACRLHPSIAFRYAVYFDMYHYSISALIIADSVAAKQYNASLHPQVKKDIAEYNTFYKKYRNLMDDVISWGYGYFLKANHQPEGKVAYGQVVTWLMAYYKKYGKAMI